MEKWVIGNGRDRLDGDARWTEIDALYRPPGSQVKLNQYDSPVPGARGTSPSAYFSTGIRIA